MKIDVEQLTASGRQVSGQAQDLAAGFLTADNRLEAAQYGWAGMSATALSARAARWLPVSQALVGRVGDHGFALQDAAVAHAAAEEQRAHALADVAARAAALRGRG
ncbi:hypothetical protein AWC05_07665 [Mycobacterium florentinum]|uniref:WXG100 family type VII secretion target n=1 Tax=Mycobacterium florentinum TaxID=292462 RepID=A0A1X1TW10_MYCFL|nr:hypothetical protein [Mycobacterium florentinum]ORV48579.1 hypothetical protein AWC05_07665 [Mycobacterium florentinum]